jgi:hypothetical protein
MHSPAERLSSEWRSADFFGWENSGDRTLPSPSLRRFIRQAVVLRIAGMKSAGTSSRPFVAITLNVMSG